MTQYTGIPLCNTELLYSTIFQYLLAQPYYLMTSKIQQYHPIMEIKLMTLFNNSDYHLKYKSNLFKVYNMNIFHRLLNYSTFTFNITIGTQTVVQIYGTDPDQTLISSFTDCIIRFKFLKSFLIGHPFSNFKDGCVYYMNL